MVPGYFDCFHSKNSQSNTYNSNTIPELNDTGLQDTLHLLQHIYNINLIQQFCKGIRVYSYNFYNFHEFTDKTNAKSIKTKSRT